jgi:hypothetical protein
MVERLGEADKQVPHDTENRSGAWDRDTDQGT